MPMCAKPNISALFKAPELLGIWSSVMASDFIGTIESSGTVQPHCREDLTTAWATSVGTT